MSHYLDDDVPDQRGPGQQIVQAIVPRSCKGQPVATPKTGRYVVGYSGQSLHEHVRCTSFGSTQVIPVLRLQTARVARLLLPLNSSSSGLRYQNVVSTGT